MDSSGRQRALHTMSKVSPQIGYASNNLPCKGIGALLPRITEVVWECQVTLARLTYTSKPHLALVAANKGLDIRYSVRLAWMKHWP